MSIGFFEFLLGAVLIGTIGGVIQSGQKVRREKYRAERRGAGEETAVLQGVVADLHQDIAKLKDRVRVLEKLVTDDDRRLSDEIDRLRRSETNSRV